MNSEIVSIKLICVAGLSTNFLSKKIQKEAIARNQCLNITAISEVYLNEEISNTDLILIAPQIDYLYDEILTCIDRAKTIVKIIPYPLYGSMNGEKMLLFINESMKDIGEVEEYEKERN